ncbi:MAG: udp-glucuronosyltransferase, partial [Betaproteobacteria bacterium]
MRLGFLHPSSLAGLCRGWHALIDAVAPDLLVFDYAPTALLATRSLGLPRVQFGSSFSVPPRMQPMPVYRWWHREDQARVVQSERMVLECANAALARLGEPPMQRLS